MALASAQTSMLSVRLEQHRRTTRGWVCCRRANDLSLAARAMLTKFQGPKNLRRCWRDGRRVTQSRSGARPNHGDQEGAILLRLPQTLKLAIEKSAALAGVSINTWLMRCAERAVASETRVEGKSWQWRKRPVNRISVNQCAQCGADLIAAEWSEQVTDCCVRNVWSCEACGYQFEDTVYLSAREAADAS